MCDSIVARRFVYRGREWQRWHLCVFISYPRRRVADADGANIIANNGKREVEGDTPSALRYRNRGGRPFLLPSSFSGDARGKRDPHLERSDRTSRVRGRSPRGRARIAEAEMRPSKRFAIAKDDPLPGPSQTRPRSELLFRLEDASRTFIAAPPDASQPLHQRRRHIRPTSAPRVVVVVVVVAVFFPYVAAIAIAVP